MARRRLILVGGTPGSGKTTVSQALSRTLGWTVIGTDPIRKELTGRDPTERDFADPGAGIYRPEVSEATYTEVFRRAELLLEGGESVILDASFSDPAHREGAREVGRRCGADMVELECVLDPDTARIRIERRLNDDNDASDARPEILDELRAMHAPWPEATSVLTAGPLDSAEAAALAAVRAR